MRLPATLKRAVDAAANEKKLSGNAWVMQCIERCLEGTSQFGGNEIASSLIQKLLDGDEELPIRFQKAKVFWTDFFNKNAQQPISALAKELGLQQGKFEAIFEDSERSFAKEMMPLTCLGVLYSNQKNQSLTRKVVEAFRKSDVSGEIKNAHL